MQDYELVEVPKRVYDYIWARAYRAGYEDGQLDGCKAAVEARLELAALRLAHLRGET